MKYMTCNTCRATVQVNNTGICLGCQQGSNKAEKADHHRDYKSNELKELLSREKAIEDALLAAAFESKTTKGKELPKKVKKDKG